MSGISAPQPAPLAIAGTEGLLVAYARGVNAHLERIRDGQVAAPVYGAIARQVLLYLGIRPERQAPGLWPGEVQVASVVSPDKRPAPEESPPPEEPAAFEPAEDIGIVETESVPSSTGGGRSHAPF